MAESAAGGVAPDKFLAPVLREFGGRMPLEPLTVPAPGDGAVVVRMVTATVCGSDVHLWYGDTKDALPTTLPLVLGHEVVGEVVAAGPGADVDSIGQPLALGDRVVWTPAPCGRCHACSVLKRPALCPHLVVGMHRSVEESPHAHGGFSPYIYVGAASRRLRVPDDVEDTWAAAASCAGRSAVAAVRRPGRIEGIDHVLVQGAGPLGLFVTALASISAPRSLTVTDTDAGRLELASRWGATHTVLVDPADPVRHRGEVLSISEGRGVDVAFECSGGRGAVAEGVDLVARGGRYVISGTVGGPRQEVDVARICLSGISVEGVFSAEIDDYWRAMTFMGRHRDRFDWDAMFGSSAYGLDQVESALTAMHERREIKPVVRPTVEETP